MKKYIITKQDGYSVKFYLIDEDEKNVLMQTKSWDGVSSRNTFTKIKDLFEFLTKNNLTLGSEEFVAYSSDVLLSSR